MKTILVPTDFSDTARNAALFALPLAKQLGMDRIVLYNAYQAPISVDPMLPSVQLLDIDFMKKSSEQGLANFKAKLQEQPHGNLPIDTFSEYNVLSGGINDLSKAVQAGLIVMGITGGGAVTETLIGSNAVSVSLHSEITVLIVPAEASFQKINRVMLACNFKQVSATTNIQPLIALLDATSAKLFVLQVNAPTENDNNLSIENGVLDGLLKNYKPEYHIVNNHSFTEGINHFAENNQIDMIITMPKKHGFFESLLKKSHTKKLAFHSHLPLMVMHE